jgi:hypothetical protein
MATQTAVKTEAEHSSEVLDKIQQFRELFADAPEIGKKALENAIQVLKSQASDPPPAIESAGRVGARLGKVSELTIIVPLAPGGGEAFARVPKAAGRKPFARRGQGRHPPHHALRVLR